MIAKLDVADWPGIKSVMSRVVSLLYVKGWGGEKRPHMDCRVERDEDIDYRFEWDVGF